MFGRMWTSYRSVGCIVNRTGREGYTKRFESKPEDG
jgi:hypothetical protein